MQLWASVGSSVRPYVPPDRRTPLLRICCCGPGGQEISIDCCTAGGQQQRRRSTARSSKSGEWRRKLNTDLVQMFMMKSTTAVRDSEIDSCTARSIGGSSPSCWEGQASYFGSAARAEGQSQGPEEPIARVGFLGMGKLASSPPARRSGGSAVSSHSGVQGRAPAAKGFF